MIEDKKLSPEEVEDSIKRKHEEGERQRELLEKLRSWAWAESIPTKRFYREDKNCQSYWHAWMPGEEYPLLGKTELEVLEKAYRDFKEPL